MSASAERRKSEPEKVKRKFKELFREEDIKLNWTSIRRTVGLLMRCYLPIVTTLWRFTLISLAVNGRWLSVWLLESDKNGV